MSGLHLARFVFLFLLILLVSYLVYANVSEDR
jgi:hypothetical protein